MGPQMCLSASLALETFGRCSDALSTEHYATDSITLQTQPAISLGRVCGLPNVWDYTTAWFFTTITNLKYGMWQTMPGSESAGPSTSPYTKLVTTCHKSFMNAHFGWKMTATLISEWHHKNPPKCWCMERLQQGGVMPLKEHVYKRYISPAK